MGLDQLKQFAAALQMEVKRCETSEPLNPQHIKQETLDKLVKERNMLKQLAVGEEKKQNDYSVVLDSQKRILDKSNKYQESGQGEVTQQDLNRIPSRLSEIQKGSL